MVGATTNEGVSRSAITQVEVVETDEMELTTPQSILMLALERGNILEVHHALSCIPKPKRRSILLAPSKLPEHRLRTPLMAAAATGNLAILGAVLEGINIIFRGKHGIDKTTKARLKEDRNLAMQTQLRVVDIGGANLLMIAASAASIVVFTAVTREIRPSQARNILTRRDLRGTTYLMYAVNPNAMNDRSSVEIPKPHSNSEGVSNKQECQSGILHHRPTQTLSPSIAPKASEEDESVGAAQAALDQDFRLESPAANPWVPIVKRVLEYARKCLCLPEYIELLQSKDSWDRSIIEHAIASGRHAVFDTVFEIIRRDVYDEEIERMVEVGEDNEYGETAMRAALVSEGGKKMEDLVRGKIRHLKRDVAFRAESSTVTSKIQAFIPGNLIVIFHLLLPEIRQDCHAPLVLLAFLCCIAPCWAWAASLVTKTQPERQNSLARITWARHVLACPSMFFWGLGTSTIGQYSFGWNESMTAAALAVATVIIPAIDSFAAGTGARALYGTIYIKVLSMYDSMNAKIQSWFKKKVHQETLWALDDDDWQIPSFLNPPRENMVSGHKDTSTYDKRSPYPFSTLDRKEVIHRRWYSLEAPACDGAKPKAVVAKSQEPMLSGNTQQRQFLASAIEMGHEEKLQEIVDYSSTHV